jgi:hypothetical protein
MFLICHLLLNVESAIRFGLEPKKPLMFKRFFCSSVAS